VFLLLPASQPRSAGLAVMAVGGGDRGVGGNYWQQRRGIVGLPSGEGPGRTVAWTRKGP